MRTLEEALVEKLIDIGGLKEEEAADVAFTVVEQLDEEGLFDDLYRRDEDDDE